jgi:hypothetical protein
MTERDHVGPHDAEKIVVDYPRMVCPVCGLYDPLVLRTEYPIRYHRCRNPKCNFSFRSYDTGPPKEARGEMADDGI